MLDAAEGVTMSALVARFAYPRGPLGLLGLLAHLAMAVRTAGHARTTVIGETCQWETLKVTCPSPDQVIVMQRAQYGRMRRGRCSQKDFGYEGCVVNVISIADKLCSGQRQCKIDVYRALGHLRPCSELESYLATVYTCVTVRYRENQCGWNDPPLTISSTTSVTSWQRAPARASDGGLNDVIADDDVITAVSGVCFNYLRAQRGQRWQITLLDLTRPAHAQTLLNDMSTCTRYARVREANETDFVICGGYGRVRTVYESRTAAVDVRFIANRERWVNGVPPRFIFRYEVLGCPDPEIPAAAEWRRVGDSIFVVCKHVNHKWSMRCYGDAWMGSGNNCSVDIYSQWTRWDSEPRTAIHDTILMILLGIAVGSMVGISLIFIATATFSRQGSASANEVIPLGIVPAGYEGSPVKRPSPPVSPAAAQATTCFDDLPPSSYGLDVGLEEGPLVRDSTPGGATGLWVAGGREFVCLSPRGAASVCSTNASSSEGDYASSVCRLYSGNEHVYQTPL